MAQILLALDASLASRQHCDIAIALFGEGRVRRDWHHLHNYLRDHVRRAIACGRELMNSGYRKFLRCSGILAASVKVSDFSHSVRLYLKENCARRARVPKIILNSFPSNASPIRLPGVVLSFSPLQAGNPRGMVETPDSGWEVAGTHVAGMAMTVSEIENWFVREVLPLETQLMQFLRRSWRNPADIDDLCQDIYVRVFEAAREQIPDSAKSFVFAAARNMLIDRARRAHIVRIEAVADPDALGLASEEPSLDRTIMAREELRRLQVALDGIPPAYRDALLMKKLEGLSRREIAVRLGISEQAVKLHIANAMYALADFVYGDRADRGGSP